MRAGYVSFRSPEDFPKVSEAPPVYAEPGAEEIARPLAAALRQTGDLQTAWPTVYPDSPDVMWARFTADISRQAAAN